jgi:hypothetical protein
MTFNHQNLVNLNYDERLPKLEGVLFESKIKKEIRKISDEFVDIEEDNNNNLHAPNNTINTVNTSNHQPVNNPKRNIEDLFNLLDNDTKPVNQEIPITNNISHNHTNNIIHNHNVNNFSINTNNFPNTNNQIEDDEFVDIEESTVNIEDKHETVNSIEINIVNNNHNIPDNTITPIITKEEEFNFQRIFDKNYIPNKKHEDEEYITNKVNILNTNINTDNIQKNKVSLDELFSSTDLNLPEVKIENGEKVEIKQNVIERVDLQQEIKNNNEDMDDLEFCNVEEDNGIHEGDIGASENIIHINTENDYTEAIMITEGNENEIKEPQVPHVSILNYTPDDFLNEFKKENKVEDHFEFVVINVYIFNIGRKY